MPGAGRRQPRERPEPAPAPGVPEPPLPDVLAGLGAARVLEYGNLAGEPLGLEAPLFLDSGPVPIATAPPVISGARALVQGDNWSPTPLPQGLGPEYRYKDTRGWITHNITAQDPESGRLECLIGDQAWKIVNAFDTPTAFLHLAFSAYAARQEKPWAGEMQIRGTDLINALGLGHRKDLSKAEKLGRIVTQARLLNSLGVCIDWALPNSPRWVVNLSRMWEVSFTVTGQSRLRLPAEADLPADPLLDRIADEVILNVRPGKWAEFFLNRGGLKAGSSLFWVGYMAESVLQFDPYQEPIASRLAVLLTLTLGTGNPRRTVQPLIDYAFSAAEREAAQHGRDARYNVKQAFDNALHTLSRAGWRITFPEGSYPAYLVPAWARSPGSAPAGRLPRGYWPAFLKATLEIRPPGDIPERLAANRGQLPGQAGAKKAKARPRSMTGEEVRQARTRRGLSQKQLGDILGKSQTWVARVERGTRTPAPEDYARLRAIFAESGREQA